MVGVEVEVEVEMEMEAEDTRLSLMCEITMHSKIYKTQRSRRITSRLNQWTRDGRNPDEDHNGRPYNFIFDCCALSINLQNEIITRYYSPVRHNFHPFFPELDSLVVDPVAYLRVVKKIIGGMEARNVIFSDSLLLDLQQEGLLPPSMVTAVSAVRSSLSICPKILALETILKMSTACKKSFALDSIRKKLDAFVHSSSRIGLLAPNLSALVGTAVAAMLIGAAGGLSELSTLPISNVLFLSAANCRKDHRYDKALVTCTTVFDHPQQEEQQQQQLPDGIMGCFVAQTDIIRSTPQHRLQIKACHSLAEGINQAATIDLNFTDPTGETGRAMGEAIRMMIEKWKEEDSAMLMKLRTELPERPKKNKLAVSKDYSKMFKPDLNKEKPRDIPISKRDSRAKRAEMVFASLKECGLTTTTSSSSVAATNLQAH